MIIVHDYDINEDVVIGDISSYSVELSEIGSNDLSYNFNVVSDGKKITIFNISSRFISLNCKLTLKNILDLLELIEEKEHTFPITKINPDKCTDKFLILINKILISIYGSDEKHFELLRKFLEEKYDKNELEIIFGYKDGKINFKIDTEESNALMFSKYFEIDKNFVMKINDKNIISNAEEVKCRLVNENSSLINFNVLSFSKNGMIEETLYGTYSVNQKKFYPREKEMDRDRLISLLKWVKEDIKDNNKDIYKNIFKTLISVCNYGNDQEIIDLYKDLFGKYISFFESILDNKDDMHYSFISLPKLNAGMIVPSNKEVYHLNQYAVCLNDYNYTYDPSVGRDNEVKDVMVSLVQGSTILVGEAGVGKTALVEGLAYKINTGEVPTFLKDKRIYKITSSDIVSGCGVVGDIEERMKNILDDVIKAGNIILFFDEIHTAFGTGKGRNGTLDIANILKPYVDRGQVQMIGATTSLEYDEYFDSDPAFKRRFEKVVIKEPDEDSLYKIIDNVLSSQEMQFNKYLNSNIDRNGFINSMILLTKKNHRDQMNMEYNPSLVLSIIRKAFSYSVFYENDNLELSDIEEAINKNSIISLPAKEEFERNKKNLEEKHEKIQKKVIEFNSNK